MTAAEPTPVVDLRTRIAAAFEAEDSRNWGYDHDFAADDAETLAFADAAIAVMAAEIEQLRADAARWETCAIEAARAAADDEPFDDGVTVSQAAMEETLAAADEDRDRLAAELVEARAEVERWRAAEAKRLRGLLAEAPPVDISADERGEAGPPPLPTTEDYRVVLRDEAAVDEPSGGWQQIGSTVPTLAAAIEQRATRRRYHPDWPEMRVWRRQDVWSVAAVETRDASRAPESPAGAATPRETPKA